MLTNTSLLREKARTNTCLEPRYPPYTLQMVPAHMPSVAIDTRIRCSLAAVAALALSACADTITSPSVVAPITHIAASGISVQQQAQIDVGEQIFNDKKLSLKGNQSCASCHDAAFGYSAPNSAINNAGSVMPGSVTTRFAIRRPPTAAYSTFSPVLYFDPNDDTYVGGMFWDGRATGEITGSPAADQALAPFLGKNEMALADKACVVFGVATSTYLAKYKAAWGNQISTIPFTASTKALCAKENITVALAPAERAKVDAEYLNIARSIGAFEGSSKVSAFSAKYDRYLAGTEQLTDKELLGLDMFENKAGCAGCHTNAGEHALFTDFTYDNIGVPANPQNPEFIANGFVDLGIGGFTHEEGRDGAQKVPTLRNIDKRANALDVKSYMHNGAFKSLAQVVHFYNTRDVLPRCVGTVLPNDPRFGNICWPAPEVDRNVNVDELGNLGLTPTEESALVAYLKTLSDR